MSAPGENPPAAAPQVQDSSIGPPSMAAVTNTYMPWAPQMFPQMNQMFNFVKTDAGGVPQMMGVPPAGMQMRMAPPQMMGMNFGLVPGMFEVPGVPQMPGMGMPMAPRHPTTPAEMAMMMGSSSGDNPLPSLDFARQQALLSQTLNRAREDEQAKQLFALQQAQRVPNIFPMQNPATSTATRPTPPQGNATATPDAATAAAAAAVVKSVAAAKAAADLPRALSQPKAAGKARRKPPDDPEVAARRKRPKVSLKAAEGAADGAFPCTTCEKVFESRAALSGHGRFCSGGMLALASVHCSILCGP